MKKSLFVLLIVTVVLVICYSCVILDKKDDSLDNKTVFPERFMVNIPDSLISEDTSIDNSEIIFDLTSCSYNNIKNLISHSRNDIAYIMHSGYKIDTFINELTPGNDLISGMKITYTQDLIDKLNDASINNFDELLGTDEIMPDFKYQKSDNPAYDKMITFFTKDEIGYDQVFYWLDDGSMIKYTYEVFTGNGEQFESITYNDTNKSAVISSKRNYIRIEDNVVTETFEYSIKFKESEDSENKGLFISFESASKDSVLDLDYYLYGYADNNGGRVETVYSANFLNNINHIIKYNDAFNTSSLVYSVYDLNGVFQETSYDDTVTFDSYSDFFNLYTDNQSDLLKVSFVNSVYSDKIDNSLFYDFTYETNQYDLYIISLEEFTPEQIEVLECNSTEQTVIDDIVAVTSGIGFSYDGIRIVITPQQDLSGDIEPPYYLYEFSPDNKTCDLVDTYFGA